MCAIHLHTSFHQSVSLFVSARGMLGMPPALSEDLVTLRIAGKAYDITSAVTSARRMSEMLPSHARSLIELATSSTKSLEMSSKCLWQAAEKANAGFMVEFFATADDQITVQTCIEYKGRNQETPFLVACRLGHVQCVTILMHYGANVHAVDRHGNTGLHHACRQGHVALVQLLVGHVPVWLQNSSRLSALDLCRQQLRLRRRNVHMARCLECLENRVKLFEGWIELSEATVGSMLTGLRVLQAWNLRCLLDCARTTPAHSNHGVCGPNPPGDAPERRAQTASTSALYLCIARRAETKRHVRWRHAKDRVCRGESTGLGSVGHLFQCNAKRSQGRRQRTDGRLR
ncbi:hypothetical protein, variant 2 [Aphanomyces invadans]|uniref:Uncharacterized protein n=1 Tax=Aphanomyces invadans TaxID=157072 RepID=A0A024U3S8_9STRA|nr:hypothetical protein, variant 2 [Aphanomyces invadans]ETW00870.1 hypothetical protein, variant 2 [Aphanomyces invadans]|eukprot:XP_008871005.1 hypothetical protein, variant 2 [Aphanomyces invadans]